jgi:chromosome segregation protein
VFLKSLSLKGFKSFADPTSLEFEPGVAVVVGPNGSGKSNIVDAVAWVLGAQGPSTVRSAKMEDVIFAGTPRRAALGRAQVELTIDNSAGLLPIDFSEVTITRTLFRTGDSEYAINQVPCRLLDIQELLSDTGVGRQQHVIVSQGNLDAILSSRPEERRLVIEEAAGILKFRRRKERSERRLESTEASLVRLQDLLREVRRQLRPLEKQAEAARRHGGLVDELTAIRRYLLGRELGHVEARLAAAARNRTDLGRSEELLGHELASLDGEILTAEARTEGARSAESEEDLADALSRAEGLRARAAGQVALLEERRRSVNRALAASIDRDVISALEAEAAELNDRLATADQEAGRLLPLADELADAERTLRDETAAVDAQWGAAVRAQAHPAAEVKGELVVLRAALSRSGNEVTRLDARIGGIERRLDRLRAERARLGQVISESDGADGRLNGAAEAAFEAAAEAERLIEQARAAHRQAEAERHRWVARQEALAQALDHARAKAGAQQLSEVPGVLGTLLELVEVDTGFERAFEAAAGPALAAVVVDGVDSARRGLAELQRVQVSGAVVPLAGRLDQRQSQPAANEPGRFPATVLSGQEATTVLSGPEAMGSATAPAPLSFLRRRVRAGSPGVAALLDDILRDAVVVDDGWEAAADVVVAHPHLLVVTRAGDRFERGVWRVGDGGVVATGAALEEAAHHAAASVAEVASADQQFRESQDRAHAQGRERERARRALEDNRARYRIASEALPRVETELEEAGVEQASAVAEREEMAARLERDRARVAELEAALPGLEAEAEAEAERVAAERIARSRLARLVADTAARRKDLEVRAAGLEERRSLTVRRLQEVQERLQRNRAERDGATARRQGLERSLRVTDRLMALVRNRRGELDAIHERLHAARRAEVERARRHSDQLEQLRRRRSHAERQLGEVRQKLGRVEVEDAEVRVRLESLTETVRRDLDCEPEAIRAAVCPALPAATSASSRRTELERELRLMGPINPLALEEHAALVERHQFLEAQLEDVRQARRELSKVIRAIDAEITEVFRAAYADVADNFEALFGTLFPGGQGRLRLTDPDHLLETGIEVEARPSGKNVRRLSLLSGGERSLTAMAFLFAVFRSRPSPFYLMDEVEAALDDVNLHRFLDLVHQFRSEAQLLIVTHQKRTMEAADCLYGVTMAPGGSSRVVSERVRVPAAG